MNKQTNSLKSTYSFKPIVKNLNLTLVLILTLLSCGSSDEEPQGLKINSSLVKINFNDSIKIDATSDFPIKYSSVDPYIAYVEGDYIKARHIGNTIITLSSNNEVGLIEVDVKSIYSLFDHPISSYKHGKEYYHENYTDLYYEDETILVFLQVNYKEKTSYLLQFDFTENNTTKDAFLIFQIGDINNVFDTLIERYEIYDYSNEGYIFMNALEAKEATEIATLVLDRENQLCFVLITQVENTGSKSIMKDGLQLKTYISQIQSKMNTYRTKNRKELFEKDFD